MGLKSVNADLNRNVFRCRLNCYSVYECSRFYSRQIVEARHLFAGLLYSVDDSLTLRLGDSALSSMLFPLDYHCFHGSARLPVKWMSMEALEDGIYTAQSDVVKSLLSLINSLEHLYHQQ